MSRPIKDLRTPLLAILAKYKAKCGTDTRESLVDVVATLAAIVEDAGIPPTDESVWGREGDYLFRHDTATVSLSYLAFG